MTEPTNENQLTMTDENMQLPAFAQSDVGEGMEQVEKFVRPPIFKIVQPQSGDDLKEDYEVGEAICLPTFTKIAGLQDRKTGVPFLAVPVFFWPEWQTRNPQKRGDEPAIRARSFDPGCEIAVKARNPEARKERVPEFEDPISHEEHLNFLICLYNAPDNPLNNEPMVVSFSKTGHSDGEVLNNLLKMRKAAIYANVFQFNTYYDSNSSGNWFGLRVKNPTGPAYVQDEALYTHFQALHRKFKDAHASSLLVVDEEQAPTKSNAEDGVAAEGGEF